MKERWHRKNRPAGSKRWNLLRFTNADISGGNSGSNGGGDLGNLTYATVLLNKWNEDGTTGNVFGVDVPSGKDPKLVPVDRTELSAGLYEFLVVLNNGQIMRRFEYFDRPQVINADFADFINVNIYPVPVKGGEFAVDIDLLIPSQVILTIVNNMGKEFYYKELDLEQSGRHKHIVDMGYPWPSGVYHAIFGYGDGSSRSKTFSIQQ